MATLTIEVVSGPTVEVEIAPVGYQGPRGPQGPQGDVGPQGPQGGPPPVVILNTADDLPGTPVPGTWYVVRA